MARILSFIYDRFDGNYLADMLEKKHVGSDKKQASQKKTSTIITEPFSALDWISCRLDSIALALTLGQLLLVRPMPYFYFRFASSNWPTAI